MADTPQFILFGNPEVAPVDKVQDPTTVLSGNPAQKSWLYVDEQKARARYGIWDSQAGHFQATMSGIVEFCTIIEGSTEITNLDDGTTQTVKSGDAFVMQEGLRTEWHVPKYVKKYFVISDA